MTEAADPKPDAGLAGAPAPVRVGAFSSLGFYEFRLVLISFLVGFVGFQIRQVTNLWLIYEITAETTEPVQGSALYEGQTVNYSDATDARKVMVYVGQTSGGDDETDEQMLAKRLSGHDGAAVSGMVAQPAWQNATKTIRAVKRCDTLADARRSESALALIVHENW